MVLLDKEPPVALASGKRLQEKSLCLRAAFQNRYPGPLSACFKQRHGRLGQELEAIHPYRPFQLKRKRKRTNKESKSCFCQNNATHPLAEDGALFSKHSLSPASGQGEKMWAPAQPFLPSPWAQDAMQCHFHSLPPCPVLPLDLPLQVKGPALQGEPGLWARLPEKVVAGITRMSRHAHHRPG